MSVVGGIAEVNPLHGVLDCHPSDAQESSQQCCGSFAVWKRTQSYAKYKEAEEEHHLGRRGMPLAARAIPAIRAKATIAANSGSANNLAMTPCVLSTSVAANVTKFPVTCAINSPCRPRKPAVSTNPPLKRASHGLSSRAFPIVVELMIPNRNPH
jgi:hypothetical protein